MTNSGSASGNKFPFGRGAIDIAEDKMRDKESEARHIAVDLIEGLILEEIGNGGPVFIDYKSGLGTGEELVKTIGLRLVPVSKDTDLNKYFFKPTGRRDELFLHIPFHGESIPDTEEEVENMAANSPHIAFTELRVPSGRNGIKVLRTKITYNDTSPYMSFEETGGSLMSGRQVDEMYAGGIMTDARFTSRESLLNDLMERIINFEVRALY